MNQCSVYTISFRRVLCYEFFYSDSYPCFENINIKPKSTYLQGSIKGKQAWYFNGNKSEDVLVKSNEICMDLRTTEI